MIIAAKYFLSAQEVELHKDNGERIALRLPFKGSAGFSFEIRAAHQAMHSGQIECPVMPLDETAAIAQTMDRLQNQFKSD